MVLQVIGWGGGGDLSQSGGAALWGWGGPGAEVEVTLGTASLARTRVGAQGGWRVGVVLAAGGPYNLTVHHRWGPPAGMEVILQVDKYGGEVGAAGVGRRGGWWGIPLLFACGQYAGTLNRHIVHHRERFKKNILQF